jgi:prophage antirepressor-like protein
MHIRIPLHFRSHVVHAVIGGDQPWFSHDDVCRVLSVFDPTAAAAYLDDYERSVATVPGPTGMQPVKLVSLGGVYSLLAHSPDAATARSFKRWIAAEVVPSLPIRCESVALPAMPEEGLHSTTQIADILRMSPSTLGRQAGHLKTDRHGELRPAAALNSGRPVQQWWWNDEGRDAVLRKYGRSAAVNA